MDIYTAANQMKLERKTIYDLNIRVTFYARVSTTRDEQENSIENQIMYFTDLIKNNPNWEYVEGYVDRIRGEAAENRVQFMQMIADGKAGDFDLILTKEVSRFARNTIDSLTYTRDLLRAGVGVFFQNDNICTIDTDSELRLTIMSSIAADEVRKLSDRIKWGHKRSIESGNVLGNNRIFGYDLYDKKLHINESEAEMVRQIFDLYATGNYSVRKIADVLYEKGYRGRNGTMIHHNTISGIIQNPKYKGYYCGGKVRITDFRTRQQRFLPEDEWTMFKDETGKTVPAIVSEDIWEKCNSIFRERSAVVKSRERSFKNKSVLSGKIWCTVDGRAYWRTSYSNSVQKGHSIYQWICSEKQRYGTKSCPSISIMEAELYQMLGEYFQSIIPNITDYMENFISIYKQSSASEDLRKQISGLEAKLSRETAKRDKLLELYLDGSVSKEEFKKRNDDLGQTIMSIETDISDLKHRSSNTNSFIDSMKQVESAIKTFYTEGKPMPNELIDELIVTMIERIDVTPVDNHTMSLCIKIISGENKTCNYNKRTAKSKRISRDSNCGLDIISFTI